MHTCKITVIRRMANQELADEYLADTEGFGPCDRFSDGQEFVVDMAFAMPEDFCPWAWADIRHDILTIAVGGDLHWMKQRGMTITGCTDWFRPVYFKVERME